MIDLGEDTVVHSDYEVIELEDNVVVHVDYENYFSIMIDHGDDSVLHVNYKKNRLAMKVLEGNDLVYVDYE